MQLILTFFGALSLYSSSKYYPAEANVLKNRAWATSRMRNYVAFCCLLLATLLSIVEYGTGTGLFVFFASFISSLCCLLVIVPLNKRWIYLTVSFCLLLVILENLRYYAS